MNSWQQDQFHSLIVEMDENTPFTTFVHAAKEIGFEYCCYGLRAPFPISRPRFFVCNNYSEEWSKRYREKNYLAIDPTFLHGASSLEAVIWSDELFASAKDLWSEARSFGLRYGWAQSSHDRRGFVGLFSLGRSEGSLTDLEMEARRFHMSWLAQAVHVVMSKYIVPRLEPLTQIKLSSREREVLLWTAEGKTTNEIGCILSLTDRTVNFHINNSMIKLSASNKTAAAIKGAILGLLY